jgi:hypothetical protein
LNEISKLAIHIQEKSGRLAPIFCGCGLGGQVGDLGFGRKPRPKLADGRPYDRRVSGNKKPLTCKGFCFKTSAKHWKGYYPSIAPSVGQAAKQALQSMQVSGSTTYFPAPFEIAPTGHSASQTPQETQRSVMV